VRRALTAHGCFATHDRRGDRAEPLTRPLRRAVRQGESPTVPGSQSGTQLKETQHAPLAIPIQTPRDGDGGR
jgi:hypothetical protein